MSKLIVIDYCSQCYNRYLNKETGYSFCVHPDWDESDGRLILDSKNKLYIKIPVWCTLADDDHYDPVYPYDV